MRLLISLILCAPLTFIAHSTPVVGEGSTTEPVYEGAEMFQPSIDSLIKESFKMGDQQVTALLEHYFTIENGKNGAIVYRPKTVIIEIEQVVMGMDAGTSTQQIVLRKVSIPLITLASINMHQIKSATIDELGNTVINIGEMPLPTGLQTLINMLGKSIVPIEPEN